MKQWTKNKWNTDYLESISRVCAFIPRVSSRPFGMSLPRTSWVRLNRLQTGVEPFRSSMYKWVSLYYRIANVAPLSKLQIPLYLHVSCIMYQEEHEVCRFWMTKLDVDLTPPLPASNLGSEAAWTPARWRSGESVRIAVGRPGVHSLSRVIPKDFKNWFSQLSRLALSIKKGSVKNKPASLLVVSVSKPLNGTPPPLCGRQVAPPVLHRITIVKLLTQHFVKNDFWVPTSGSPPCWWWGYQSLKTGSKWAAIFS